MNWYVVLRAYGDWSKLGPFPTKAQGEFFLQTTRCADEAARKIEPGLYEFKGRDLIIRKDLLESNGYVP